MNLHSAVQAYFDADKSNDGEALLNAFAPDALVEDEGRSYIGHRAIGTWWRKTKAKYQTVIESLDTIGEDDVIKVRARVSGQFPTSPTTLVFAFRLKGDRISHLDIRA